MDKIHRGSLNGYMDNNNPFYEWQICISRMFLFHMDNMLYSLYTVYYWIAKKIETNWLLKLCRIPTNMMKHLETCSGRFQVVQGFQVDHFLIVSLFFRHDVISVYLHFTLYFEHQFLTFCKLLRWSFFPCWRPITSLVSLLKLSHETARMSRSLPV